MKLCKKCKKPGDLSIVEKHYGTEVQKDHLHKECIPSQKPKNYKVWHYQ